MRLPSSASSRTRSATRGDADRQTYVAPLSEIETIGVLAFTELEIITPGGEFKRGRNVRRGRTRPPQCLAAIAQLRFPEDRELALEIPAGVAKHEVQTYQPAPSRRQPLVLHLRDQSARVLASDKEAHSLERNRRRQPVRALPANQCCSRQCRSAILAR